VLADREYDPASRSSDLIRELYAGCGGADDEHAALRQLIGMAIVEGSQALD
jgi:hypothetical protein